MQKLRTCAPDVQILYIMDLAFGDVASIPEVDHCSVEATSITGGLAENVTELLRALLSYCGYELRRYSR